MNNPKSITLKVCVDNQFPVFLTKDVKIIKFQDLMIPSYLHNDVYYVSSSFIAGIVAEDSIGLGLNDLDMLRVKKVYQLEIDNVMRESKYSIKTEEGFYIAPLEFLPVFTSKVKVTNRFYKFVEMLLIQYENQNYTMVHSAL